MRAANYAAPTPAGLTTAVLDMQTAYTDAAGRTLPDYTELGAGNISGMTLAPGLYKFGTGVTIPIGVTLNGGVNDVWIFQIAQNLTIGNGAIVTLTGGAPLRRVACGRGRSFDSGARGARSLRMTRGRPVAPP